MTPERRPLSHLLVFLQLIGVALSCYPVGLTNRGPWSALALCVLGTAGGVYALLHNRIGNFGVYPEPRPGTALVTTGPYRWIRHPMYSSLLVMMAGVAVFNLAPVNFLGLSLVAAAVAAKASIEERLLTQRFPQYCAYAARTRRFVPFLY